MTPNGNLPWWKSRPWGWWWFDAQKCSAPGGWCFIHLSQDARTTNGIVKSGIHVSQREGRQYVTLGGYVDASDIAHWQPAMSLGGQRHPDMIEIPESDQWGEVHE